MSWGSPRELNNSMNSRLPFGGWYMISEMTTLVRRLHWPSGSISKGPLTPAVVTGPKSRNDATVTCVELWLATTKPRYMLDERDRVAVPSWVQFCPSRLPKPVKVLPERFSLTQV